jgi:nucleoside-diphosphate-sugar epimerase
VSARTILLFGHGELLRDVGARLAPQARAPRVVRITTTVPACDADASLELSSPSAAHDLATQLVELRPQTLAILAMSSSPVSSPEPWNDDATVAAVVLEALDRAAAQQAPPPDLLLLTSTDVYGVASGSPLVFDERDRVPHEPALATAQARRAQAQREVERRIVLWAVTAGVRVGVLRAASVLGGPLDSPLAALLRARLPLRVLGFDPPCQFVHYLDLVEAVALAIEQRCGEVLNIVGPAVLPLSRVLAEAGVVAAPLPGPLAERLAPPGFDAAHLRWRCLADGSRAAALLGFRPQRGPKECLRATF